MKKLITNRKEQLLAVAARVKKVFRKKANQLEVSAAEEFLFV